MVISKQSRRLASTVVEVRRLVRSTAVFWFLACRRIATRPKPDRDEVYANQRVSSWAVEKYPKSNVR